MVRWLEVAGIEAIAKRVISHRRTTASYLLDDALSDELVSLSVALLNFTLLVVGQDLRQAAFEGYSFRVGRSRKSSTTARSRLVVSHDDRLLRAVPQVPTGHSMVLTFHHVRSASSLQTHKQIQTSSY